MVKLTREVRFSLTSGFLNEIGSARATNSWGGWPGGLSADPFLCVRVTVEGETDPATGMLCNIKVIDDAVRTAGFQSIAETPDRDAAILIARLAEAVKRDIAQAAGEANVRLTDLELRLTPTLRLAMNTSTPDRVLLTQQFEFAAAHRLHCEELSEEENRAVFGKCNNPGGHGHNYVLDITLATTPDDLQGRVISLAEFEEVVRREVIDPFDHEHLNCEEDFAGMNPTVENIAKVIWDKLHGKFVPAQLHSVRVHETAKTMAEYCGE